MSNEESQVNCLESTPVETKISPTFSPFTSHVDKNCLPLSPAVLMLNHPSPPRAHTTSTNQPTDSTQAAAMPREGSRLGESEQNEITTSGRVEEVGRSSYRQNQDPHNSRVASTPLPDGYKQKVTPQGQTYYQHIPTGISTWSDPRVTRVPNGCLPENLLPLLALSEGWEVKHTWNGRKQFVNHNNKTTQFTDPRLVSLINRDQSPAFNLRFPPPLLELSPLSEVTRQNVVSTPPSSYQWGKSDCRDRLMLKIKKLKRELQNFTPSCFGHYEIEISRKNIFGDSYKQIMKQNPVGLRKNLNVKFKGEEGDYCGIAREWLILLSREMFNPCFGLFVSSLDNYLHINPDSHVNPNHLSYYFFIGRILGLSIIHGHYLEANFTKSFLEQLLKVPVDLDIEAGCQFSNSLLRENDITGVLEFSVNNNTFGENVTHELKPDCENIPVTEENKKEYIDLKWRLHRGCELQMKALLKGFHELIPRQLLVDFDVEDIDQVIGGLSIVDVEDWKKHTTLKQCTSNSDIVRWFWKAVEESDEERRRKILRFVFGSSRLPLQGFKDLQGSQGTRMFTIHRLPVNASDLPIPNTRLNGIAIPSYESYRIFLTNLNCAIDQMEGNANWDKYPKSQDIDMLQKRFFSKLTKDQPDEIICEILHYSYYFYMDYCLRISTQYLPFEKYGQFVSTFHLSELNLDFNELHLKYDQFLETTSRCGSVILNSDESAVLVMKGFRSDYWFLPSGKQEPSESTAECASRELFEEAGITIRFTSQPFIQKVKGKPFVKYLYIFVGFDDERILRPTVLDEVEKLG